MSDSGSSGCTSDRPFRHPCPAAHSHLAGKKCESSLARRSPRLSRVFAAVWAVPQNERALHERIVTRQRNCLSRDWVPLAMIASCNARAGLGWKEITRALHHSRHAPKSTHHCTKSGKVTPRLGQCCLLVKAEHLPILHDDAPIHDTRNHI